ncbi:MAG: tRNA pseudouridine(38-40) synthase TruA [Bacteriovoracaceae bacterium]|nr:tRNA pseudouridine(38-40) synthase TruA [Bacteroidota bacterium]
MKRNIKLIIEYDGTDFVGWQRQPNGRSVQEEIEKTLSTVTRESITITGAGRTDSGVHARGQVANFFTEKSLTAVDFHRALNGLLPEDIVIHEVEEIDEAFSSRYSAKVREYRYYISLRPVAVNRKYCWQIGYRFDIEKMNRTASSILGVHDFQAFCKSDSETEHYRCQVFESNWACTDDMLVYTVRANRFLQGMVRALVGTMVDVGRGFTHEEDFETIKASKNRSSAGQSAPAKGLFLERVTY